MSICDIIVLAILALAAVVGFFKGVEKSLARLVEVILTLAVSALAAMCVIWFGLADLEAVGPAIEEMNIDALLNSGIIFVPIAFIVMFIVSVIIGDYLYNKFIYRKRTFKSAMTNRLLGALCYFVLWLVIVYLVFAVLHCLEGTEYDLYAQLVDKSLIVPYLYDYNPFAKLIKGLFDANGLTKVLIGIINMLWPNFEYLTAMI